MPGSLQLEYACTPAERSEAESLGLRKQLGGGSKWLTVLVLLLFIVFAAGLLYEMILRDFAKGDRRAAAAGTLGVFAFSAVFVLIRRRQRRAAAQLPAKIEISENEIIIIGPGSRMAIPWSSFKDCLESSNLFVITGRANTVSLIFPKRVFPDLAWQNWFRALATNLPAPSPETAAPVTTVPPAPSAAGNIRMKFRLSVWDYLDRTLASWLTWGFIICLDAMLIGIWVDREIIHPPLHAVNGPIRMFFVFLPPVLLFMSSVVILVSWLYPLLSGGKKYLIAQELELSDSGISFVERDASGVLPWTTYTRFKETRRSFILWTGRIWLLLPKRCFASAEDQILCRKLLARHLSKSRWFFG